MIGRVSIESKHREYDGFFKIDKYNVSYQKYDGTMNQIEHLVFERGDSVAILLLNVDSKSVVLVEQFKLPVLVARRRDSPDTNDGWIIEAIAGMIDKNERPDAAVIREAKEETGYQVRDPKHIVTFYSSPGGTSERLFLYFAEVRDADRITLGGGIGDEDIRVIHLPLTELFERVAKGLIEDPKLLIAAQWLLGHMKAFDDRARLIDAYLAQHHRRPVVQAPSVSVGSPQTLDFNTIKYKIKNKSQLVIGYKTGDIRRIKDVDIWVNSENTDMMMDRFLGKSISATIRFLGANKDEEENVVEDTVEEALRSAVGRRTHVRIGTVLVTESGALLATHNVQMIFHVASVEGVGAGLGVKADKTKLERCIDNVLVRVDQVNNRFWNKRFWQEILKQKNMSSILFPMIGSGDGGLPVEEVAQAIIPPAINYLERSDMRTLTEIYFLAFSPRARDACQKVLEENCANDRLVR